jgi:hypothetical protein
MICQTLKLINWERLLMRTGIKKEEILGMLTEMAQHLDETDTNLQSSLSEHREVMCKDHTLRLAEIEILLDKMEAKVSRTRNSSASLMAEPPALKLELGF